MRFLANQSISKHTTSWFHVRISEDGFCLLRIYSLSQSESRYIDLLNNIVLQHPQPFLCVSSKFSILWWLLLATPRWHRREPSSICLFVSIVWKAGIVSSPSASPVLGWLDESGELSQRSHPMSRCWLGLGCYVGLLSSNTLWNLNWNKSRK